MDLSASVYFIRDMLLKRREYIRDLMEWAFVCVLVRTVQTLCCVLIFDRPCSLLHKTWTPMV